ncbi:MAG TPA: non-ribosomal peptide synthetase, partial [Anaerolineae bacterium]|nr:non-ribosomal peptide synthetase [Anaerolineae bacterium]
MNANQIADIYPLSPMQQGMLFHSLYAPETGNYHEQSAWKIEGKLDVDLFAQAWRAVINRHTALRTAFVWEELDEPLQIVYRQLDAPLTELDWRDVPAAEQAARLEQFLAADRAEGFDLSAAPLMRLAVMRLDGDSYYFVWSHHHLLLDGWSQQIIFKDLFTWYESLRQGIEPPLPLARPYREYIAWLQAQKRDEAEVFWQEELAGFTAPTPLTIERWHTAVEGEFILTKARLPEDVTTALQALVRQQQITLNTILQGAWALLLSRYSGEEDVLFGATTAGRPPNLPDVESMVGLFINTLPARVRIDETQPVADWLTDLHQKQTAARAYDYLPLTDLQQWSDVPADTPLFESLFVFESYPIDETVRQVSQAGSLKIAEAASFTRTNFPLLLSVSPGKQMGLVIGYDNSRFEDEAVKRMLGHLTTLLEGIAANPDCPVADLPLLTAVEQQQILVDWNDT